MFFKQRTIDIQAATIIAKNEQIALLECKLAQANEEIERVTLAADRVSIVLNEQADKDRVIKRDLVKVLALTIADDYTGGIEMPTVPDEVFPELLMMTIDAKEARGISPHTLVLQGYQIDRLLRHMKMKNGVPADEDVDLTFRGMRVVRK